MEYLVWGAAGVVMLVALVGVVFTHSIARQFLEKRLSSLVSFSAGVFLVTAGALALEVFHILDTAWQGIGLIMLGYGAAFMLHALWPETHHHHDPSCGRTHGGARKLIVGDGIHNIADGIILVPAFAISPALGLAVLVSIVVHETLQEISEFFVLRQAGYSTRAAILINFAVSSTILLGVGIGVLAIATPFMEGALLALSAGFFLHVVVHDLLPRRAHHATQGGLVLQAGLVFLGVLLMAGLQLVLGEAHIHATDHPGVVETDHHHEDDVHHDEHEHE